MQQTSYGPYQHTPLWSPELYALRVPSYGLCGPFCCGVAVYCGHTDRQGWSCWLSGPASYGGCHLTGWQGLILAWLAVGPRGSGADVGLQVGGDLGLDLAGCGAQRGPGLVLACWWVGPGNGQLVAQLGGAALRQFVYLCI